MTRWIIILTPTMTRTTASMNWNLRAMGAGRFFSAVLPLFVFALGHHVGAWADVVQPLVLGGILTGFYLWRHDLVANVLAHTLVDLIGTGVLVGILKSV